MKELVDGADVVIDVSGPVKGGPAGYRTTSTEALLDALAGTPTRLIHLTGAGVRQPGDEPKLVDRLVRTVMQAAAGSLLADSTSAVEAVNASGVTALVVRAPRLTDGEATGQTKQVGAVGRGSGMQLTRADLAVALVDLAEQSDWPEGAPVVSN